MRKWALAYGLAAVLVVVSAAGQAAAANHNFLPEASRAVEGDPPLQVVVAQGEIKSDINPSNIAAATGGGLIEALIDAKITSDRAKKPESRLSGGNLAYAQTITCVISLPAPSKDHVENAARWSAANAKLARKALAVAFDEIGLLAPRALQLQEADLKAMGSKEHKSAVVGGFGGRILEDGPSG